MNWGQKKEFFLIFICSDKESQVWLGFCNHSFSKFGSFTASENSGDLQGHRKKKMPREQTCSLKAEYLQDQSSVCRNGSISTAISIGRCSLVGFYSCTCIFQLGAQLSLAEHLGDCQIQLCAPGATGQAPGKAHVARQSCGLGQHGTLVSGLCRANGTAKHDPSSQLGEDSSTAPELQARGQLKHLADVWTHRENRFFIFVSSLFSGCFLLYFCVINSFEEMDVS